MVMGLPPTGSPCFPATLSMSLTQPSVRSATQSRNWQISDEEGVECVQTWIFLCHGAKTRIGILKIHHLLIIKPCLQRALLLRALGLCKQPFLECSQQRPKEVREELRPVSACTKERDLRWVGQTDSKGVQWGEGLQSIPMSPELKQAPVHRTGATSGKLHSIVFWLRKRWRSRLWPQRGGGQGPWGLLACPFSCLPSFY